MYEEDSGLQGFAALSLDDGSDTVVIFAPR